MFSELVFAKLPSISICVIARNEENSISALLDSLDRQTYPKDLMEIILVDGLSNDNTLEIINHFALTKSDIYKRIVVLPNEKKTQAPGWNIAISASTCECVVRLDAHAVLPDDYLERNVANFLKGEKITGGKVENLPANSSDQAIVANMAENSLFGGSIAAFRHSDKPQHVDTVAFALYDREVYEKVGLFNEKLQRTEDNEIHYRMRQAGYKFFLDPAIISYRKTRPTLATLVKQKFLNGFSIGRTLYIEPRCFSFYHFVPMLFVVLLGVFAVAALAGLPWLLLAILGAYAVIVIALSVAAVINSERKPMLSIALLVIFPALHIGYGIGTISGLLTGLCRAPDQEPSAHC